MAGFFFVVEGFFKCKTGNNTIKTYNKLAFHMVHMEVMGRSAKTEKEDLCVRENERQCSTVIKCDCVGFNVCRGVKRKQHRHTFM